RRDAVSGVLFQIGSSTRRTALASTCSTGVSRISDHAAARRDRLLRRDARPGRKPPSGADDNLRSEAALAACRTEVCGWSSDGFLRFAAAVDAQSGFVGVRLSLLDRRWSWIDGAPGRAALNRRGRGRTIAWCSR